MKSLMKATKFIKIAKKSLTLNIPENLQGKRVEVILLEYKKENDWDIKDRFKFFQMI